MEDVDFINSDGSTMNKLLLEVSTLRASPMGSLNKLLTLNLKSKSRIGAPMGS